jgi:signal transduction histidine kinase
MTLKTIQDIWMKPATPNKLDKKKSENRFTQKGRLMQGDKGVGRFAIYKLGNYIEIFTKTPTTNEVNLVLNFREFTESDEYENDIEEVNSKFLDEIPSSWFVNDTPLRVKNEKGKGTIIRISDLRNSWKKDDLDRLDKAFYKMIPPIIPEMKTIVSRDFGVELLWDGVKQPSNIMPFEKIIELAPYSFQGSIEDSGKFTYIYKHNNHEEIDEVNLFEDQLHSINKLKLFREQFYSYDKERKIWSHTRKPNIGEFVFYFYAFDWVNKIEGLTSVQEEYIKDNSVYLYRDSTRVYPYGERGIDWLMLSKFRAEDKAGSYFSYNDLTGFVFIKQRNNPQLRDAADREGLMNIDGAYDDFIALIQAGLKVMKDFVESDKRKDKIKKEKPFVTANAEFEKSFNDLQTGLTKIGDTKILDQSQKLFNATNTLIQRYKENLVITQELAGVGMAVEKASHDTFSLIHRLQQNANDFLHRFERDAVSKQELSDFLEDLGKSLEFLYQELQILQPLFRVARKVTKNVSVNEVVLRVLKFYQRELRDKIDLTIERNEDIHVKTNTGLILQVLINLMDNSVYWLNQTPSTDKKIAIEINGIENRLIFADNGPGIPKSNEDVVFMEFFSTKVEGRGLGLYIIKELLDRIGAEITLIQEQSLKILPGANFLIQFKK